MGTSRPGWPPRICRLARRGGLLPLEGPRPPGAQRLFSSRIPLHGRAAATDDFRTRPGVSVAQRRAWFVTRRFVELPDCRQSALETCGAEALPTRLADRMPGGSERGLESQ